MYIHQGFNNDPMLKYDDIVLNVSTINGHGYNEIVNGNYSENSAVLGKSVIDGMRLQYLIECRDESVCEYISDDSSTIGMDRITFQSFVSAKLSDNWDSALLFVVANITDNAMGTGLNDKNVSSIFSTILFIFGALCLFISGISIGVILHHRKRKPSIVPMNSVSAEDAKKPGGPEEATIEQGNSGAAPEISATTSGINEGQKRKYSITYDTEGQEGAPTTGVLSPVNEMSTPDPDSDLHSRDVIEEVVDPNQKTECADIAYSSHASIVRPDQAT